MPTCLAASITSVPGAAWISRPLIVNLTASAIQTFFQPQTFPTSAKRRGRPSHFVVCRNKPGDKIDRPAYMSYRRHLVRVLIRAWFAVEMFLKLMPELLDDRR